MKVLKKFFACLCAFVCVVCACSVFTSCDDDNGKTSNYEFVFTGSSSGFLNGKTFNATIYGNKDDGHSITMTVDELKAVKLSGTWTFVEGKGYKIYFADVNELFVYTAYSTESKDFTFNYTLNLGSGYGSAKMLFTCHDESFASSYDGVGLGRTPPTFSGVGYSGGSATTECYNVLKCLEDGTCIQTSTYERTGDSFRYGTWSYDGKSDAYTFIFDSLNLSDVGKRNHGDNDDGTHYYKLITGYGEYSKDILVSPTVDIANYAKTVTSVYDAATDTYHAVLVGICDSIVQFDCTFTAE